MIGETWPAGSAHEIVVRSDATVAKTGDVGVGGAGASLSTVIVWVDAAVKLSPASTAPTWTTCVPSPMFEVTTGTVVGVMTSEQGRLRV